MLTAAALLAGPRGRRLCWTLLWLGVTDDARRPDSWPRVWAAVHSADLSGWLDEFAACVARADPAALAARQAMVLESFAWTAAMARYWQEPDEQDQALAPAGAAEVLWPIAAAIAQAPDYGWWVSGADLARQRYAQFLGDRPFDEPDLSDAAQRVAAWQADTVAREEALRAKPAEPLGGWSGPWWSHPALSGLLVTTRARPRLGALRLALIEDQMGWKSARCWPLAPRAGARVYEVDGPAAWAALVTRYPLDVSRSRQHDWWRATGWTGQWLIPDYQAVARDYDAVHVSVLGYLTAAGVPVPAGPDDRARTLLAGWDPDATWWLTDSLVPAGPPEDWATEDAGGTGWHAVSPRGGGGRRRRDW
jgi:hypothetical protein